MQRFLKFAGTCLMAIAATFTFTACSSDDDDTPQPQEPQKVGRTILAYVWGDITNSDELCYCQLEYINKMEEGWDDSFDGALYVYLDPSPKFVQFSQPVLLKIKHDEGNGIVSEVVKTYEHIGRHGDMTRYPEVQNDVRKMAPANSYGLMLFGHGTGALRISSDSPEQKNTRGMGGDDNKYLENYELAQTTLTGYEFIVFHACLMANAEAAYEMRNKANYMVASEVSLESTGWGWEDALAYLYTFPKADLASFAFDATLHLATNMDAPVAATTSLYDLTQMQNLANATKKAIVESGLTQEQSCDNIRKYHFVSNTNSSHRGLKTTDLAFSTVDLHVDLPLYMAINGLATDEWTEAYRKACLLHQEVFDSSLNMTGLVAIGNGDVATMSFYNGMSIYPPHFLNYVYDNLLSPTIIKEVENGLKANSWHEASGMALLD